MKTQSPDTSLETERVLLSLLRSADPARKFRMIVSANTASRDVLGVLKVQGDALDRAYLREWAERLALTELLRRACDDAGLPSDRA